jgi:tannase/feruloyl esterase
MRAACVVGLLASVMVIEARPAAAAACAQLQTMAPADTRIDVAEENATESYTPPGAAPVKTAAPFCRVHGIITPVAGSRIGMELWLPRSGWNGKLEMFGNGGYSSAISYDLMASALRSGYATLSTDTGHNGDDPEFAAGHPERIVDWGYRAVHESIVKARQLTQAFYRHAARHVYFKGCSTGGHQVLMEAQRFPEDFDGIIAGDPGNDRTRLNAGFLWQYLANHPRGDDAHQIIPAEKLAMISRAVVRACHGLNGSRDGGLPTDNFLDDPRDCHFEPATLQCRSGDAPDCLTAPQVQALASMYAGAHDPRTGEWAYFGWPLGSEGSSAVVPSSPRGFHSGATGPSTTAGIGGHSIGARACALWKPGWRRQSMPSIRISAISARGAAS